MTTVAEAPPREAPAERRLDRRLLVAIVVLCLLGIGDAGYLTFVHYAHLKVACLAHGGCETVQASKYSKLAGIPVSVLGLIGYVAATRGSFAIFLVGTFCAGLYQASHQSYRFAAADTASVDFKAKAVSWVMAGGLFAAILGPQLVIFTKDAMPPFLFAASYLAIVRRAAI